MKILDIDDLLPHTHLPLPITLWQIFYDTTPTQKQIKLQFRLIVIGLPLIVLIAYLGELSWLTLLASLGYFLVMMIMFLGFYFRVYKKLTLKNNTPLPILTIDNHSIKVFDNHGNVMVDKPLIAYQDCNSHSWAGVNWLSISIQNKIYRYFVFLESTSLYYIEVDNKRYKINADDLNHLNNLIESIVLEVKKNPNSEFIEFNKRYYINGY